LYEEHVRLDSEELPYSQYDAIYAFSKTNTAQTGRYAVSRNKKLLTHALTHNIYIVLPKTKKNEPLSLTKPK